MNNFKITLILVVICFLGLGSCVTTQTKLSPEELSIQKIIDNNIAKPELFRLSMEWIAATFVSAKSVIEYQDKDEGIIMGKGFTTLTGPLLDLPVDVYFTIKIEVKDNKSRITISSIYLQVTSGTSISKKSIDTKEAMDFYRPQLNKIIKSYEESIIKNSSSKEGW